MKKAILAALFTLMFMFSAFAVLPSGAHAAEPVRATDDAIHIYAMTNVSFEEPTYQYITISWQTLNISIRPVVMSSTGNIEISGVDTNAWAVVSNDVDSITLSGAGGAVGLHIELSTSVDAEGDEYLHIHSYFTATNTSQYNTCSFAVYVGENSIFNTTFFDSVMSNQIYDYYGIKGAPTPVFDMPTRFGDWLLGVTNAGEFYGKGYYFLAANSYSKEAILGGYPETSALDVVLKMKKPNAEPETAPYKILDFIPYSNTSLFSVYDNESIFKEAKELGYNAVLIHDQWMMPATYDALNKTAIIDIANYAHKYGMKFGLYFGWMDFAISAYHPLSSFSDANITAMLSAWSNFTAKWKNFVDFYYFDYATVKEENSWSYNNWKYLTQIWRNTTKPIIYNGRGLWYVGGRFYPLTFESMPINTFDDYYSKLPDNDPFVHALDYPSIPWTVNFYDYSTTYAYNATLAERFVNYYDQWGMIPITLYAYKYPVNKGFPEFANDFKDWKGGMYVYHDIGGTIGTRNVQLESENEIRLLIDSSASQITVTPHIAKLPMRVFTNQSVTIELEITPSPNIIVKDLTTGKQVSWQKGSVIFTAEAGHTYVIEDVVQQSVNIGIDAGMAVMMAFIPLMMIAMFFRFFGEAMHEMQDKLRNFRK